MMFIISMIYLYQPSLCSSEAIDKLMLTGCSHIILCLQIPLVFIDTVFANPFSIY